MNESYLLVTLFSHKHMVLLASDNQPGVVGDTETLPALVMGYYGYRALPGSGDLCAFGEMNDYKFLYSREALPDTAPLVISFLEYKNRICRERTITVSIAPADGIAYSWLETVGIRQQMRSFERELWKELCERYHLSSDETFIDVSASPEVMPNRGEQYRRPTSEIKCMVGLHIESGGLLERVLPMKYAGDAHFSESQLPAYHGNMPQQIRDYLYRFQDNLNRMRFDTSDADYIGRIGKRLLSDIADIAI